MSLDKWIKGPEEEEEEEEEGVNGEKEQQEKDLKKSRSIKKEQKRSSKTTLKKYFLKCPKKSCKYQKTLMKSNLTEKDKICPRCKSEMKVNFK
ncbi:MAG: hypothetical protein BAJALOKI2v1_400037 [Promethearchaeota archaeon]|nr:MAG: hypothetical protein BAJALOKI2v1_400037 [Candidatus Lokiarchaeota archaeon]